MANLYTQRTYDAALLLASATAVASATTTTGSLILDVGSGLVDGNLIIDVASLDIASTDETYNFILEGSPDATFGTAGNITAIARQVIGYGTATAKGVDAVSDVAGRFCIPCRNERNGTTYRYVRLICISAGTTPAITYTAFLAKD